MIYVTMTDKFLSGWGNAEGKVNKLIFECENFNEAEIVADNARARSDMKYVNICTKKPSYNSTRYFVQVKNKEDYPSWYQKGFFRAQR